MRQGYCYTCLAIGGGGYFGRVTKQALDLGEGGGVLLALFDWIMSVGKYYCALFMNRQKAKLTAKSNACTQNCRERESQGDVKGLDLKGLNAQSRLFYREWIAQCSGHSPPPRPWKVSPEPTRAQ